MAQAATKLSIGAISDPITTVDRFYIIQLVQKTEQRSTTQWNREQVQEQLYNQKMDQEMSSYLQKMRRKSYIDVRE